MSPPTPRPSLGERFRSAVDTWTSSTALVTAEETLTYKELLERAEAIAGALRAAGVRSGDAVPIVVTRTECVPAMLGVLLAGAAYVPLESSMPAERLQNLLDQLGPRHVLIGQVHHTKVARPNRRVLLLEHAVTFGEFATVDLAGRPDDPAYVIFTSGSTGVPKGVAVSHHNVGRLLDQLLPLLDIGSADVWSMLHSHAFDFSVWEIFGALTSGARLLVVDESEIRAPDQVLRRLSENEVSVLSMTPAAFSIFAGLAREVPTPHLRRIILGGERLLPASLGPWFEGHGDEMPQVYNMYGITETTVHCTYRRMKACDLSEAGSPIGVAIPDLHVSIRDSAGLPVPSGKLGEICVSGPGVTLGYIGDLTASDPNFRVLADGERTYFSGDLGLERDGELWYIGRRDLQVKVRGYRIELGEVETAFASHPDVRAVCVSTNTGAAVGDHLIAWVVPPAYVDIEHLAAHVRRLLPAYMVPAHIIVVPDFPQTVNGKVDRDALVAGLAPAPSIQVDVAPSSGPLLDPAHLNRVETAVRECWHATLGQFESNDDFFEVGGDSLLAAKTIMALNRRLGAKFPIVWIFEHPRFIDFLSVVVSQVEADRNSHEAMT